MKDKQGREIVIIEGHLWPSIELWAQITNRACEVIGLVRYNPEGEVVAIYNVDYTVDGEEREGLDYDFSCRYPLAPWLRDHVTVPVRGTNGRRILIQTKNVPESGFHVGEDVVYFREGRAVKEKGSWTVKGADHVVMNSGDEWNLHPCFVVH